jgi:tetratricopeptide (TPR) repeat protein
MDMMLPPPSRQSLRLFATVVLLLAASPMPTGAQVILEPGLGAAGGQTVPTPGYDLVFAALANGDFSGGLTIAVREYQGSIKAGGQRWIDSIAAAAAVGECHYELGNFREAVAAYDEALLLSASHADWLLAVQFPLQPLQPSQQQRVATWGRSQRNTAVAAMPNTVSIRQGNADPQQVLQKGGVLAAPVNYPVRPQEIMRAFVIALYRRTEILGELARETGPLDEATKALVRRPAPPNHYSQSWIDIALGTAYWSQGKTEQALPLLNRGLLVGNQFDHGLTAWGLIVLGRIALANDQAAAAAKLFEEATYSAADHGDARGLEEAFRLASMAHAVAGLRGVPPSIAGAAEWARANLPALRMRLLAMEAEARAIAGDARGAAKALGEIDGGFLRGDPGRGSCGAQAAYAAALASYAGGEVAAGDADLTRAVTIARPRTPRLFQTSRLVEMVMAGASSISDRQADALFARLLGDPAPRDFAADPLGMLATISAARTDAFDAWIVAAARRGNDAALAAAEATLRSRWLSAQPLGGRRNAIGSLVGADPETLPRDEAARRAAVLARHPELSAILDKMKPLRAGLTAALLAQAAGPAPPGKPDDWREYGRLADRCGEAVAFVAAGRDPTLLDFPPLTAPAEIRRRLSARHLILSFHWTAAGLFGALESHERVAVWQVRQPVLLVKELTSLAKSIGLFDPVSPVSAERLATEDWRPHADRVERLLFEDSKVALGEGIDELTIVPDGLLWYLPFELLPAESVRPADDSADVKRLHDACHIRYCPTRSLAVARFEHPRGGGPVGIYTGRLFRGDRPEIAQEIAVRLASSLDHALPLPAAGGLPPTLAGSLLDTLVVFDELGGEGPIASRPLVAPMNGKGGMTFGDWATAPPKRPRLVVLPGLQTAMAGGLTKLPTRPGEDVFLAATNLLAAGARTALVSRWRVGGKVSVDLVEEFLRDQRGDGAADPAADFATPSESWRRAVELVAAEPPDLSRERRVKPSPKSPITDARHPFFWAGYLLVDCGPGIYPDAPPQPAAAIPVRPPVNPPPAPPQAAQ